jgi:hypothetical protein
VLENAADYQAFEDYQPRLTERELVRGLHRCSGDCAARPASRPATHQGELMRNRNAGTQRRANVPAPEWYDELDASTDGYSIDSRRDTSRRPDRNAGGLLSAGQPPRHGALDLLSRYEAALWRQAAQLLFMLYSAARLDASGQTHWVCFAGEESRLREGIDAMLLVIKRPIPGCAPDTDLDPSH